MLEPLRDARNRRIADEERNTQRKSNIFSNVNRLHYNRVKTIYNRTIKRNIASVVQYLKPKILINCIMGGNIIASANNFSIFWNIEVKTKTLRIFG